jgi:hypothetical protein
MPHRLGNRREWALAALAIAGAVASPASAQTPEAKQQADQLFKDGREFVKSGRYAEACPMFKESQRLDPSLASRCNIAVVCHQMTGQTGTAWAMLEEVEREAREAGKKQSLKCAQEAMEALKPDLAMISLDTRAVAGTPGLAITRDGVAVPASQWDKPVAADPGEHVIEVTATGRKPWRGTAQATAKSTYALVIPALEPERPGEPHTQPAPSPASPAPPTPGPGPGPVRVPAPPDASPRWTGLHTSAAVFTAVGGAGLIVGAVAGLISLAEGKAAGCANGFCPTQTALDSSKSAYAAGNVATAGFVIGGVAGAGAVVLWVVAPSRSTPAQARWQRPSIASVGVGPSGVSLRGTW